MLKICNLQSRDYSPQYIGKNLQPATCNQSTVHNLLRNRNPATFNQYTGQNTTYKMPQQAAGEGSGMGLWKKRSVCAPELIVTGHRRRHSHRGQQPRGADDG